MIHYRLAEATIDSQDLEALCGWLRTSPWLTQGELVHEFERRWAAWIGSRHAVFVNSGSSANLLMYAALLDERSVRPKVVVPAVSWSTSVAPAIALGFEPLMCDACPETFGIELNGLEHLLKTQHPAAVLIVHVLGVPCDMDGLLALQRRYGFTLLEDACAATGSRYRDRSVGTFGAMSSFSFYFGHHLSTIEGGMICTDDHALYERLLMLRSHGWAKDLDPVTEATLARSAGALDFNRPFTFYEVGWNVRSTDLNAKLGLLQMDKKDHVMQRRIENHRAYQRHFDAESGFHCQHNDAGTICSIAFGALAPSLSARDRVAMALRAAGIETRPLGGGNMSRQPFWTKRYGVRAFPMADRIHQTALQLPNHPGLQPQDIAHIAQTAISAARAIAA